MVKFYRAIQQWNRWLSNFIGSELLDAENKLLSRLLEHCYGNHAVLIGVPQQYALLNNGPISDRVLITPVAIHDKNVRHIEAEWAELPISSGSVDLVILPHSLECIDNPRHALSEACRIVKPEGSLIIFGFNPYSLLGLQQWLAESRGLTVINTGNFHSANLIKQWLTLADFELQKQKTLLFRPFINQTTLFQKLKILDWMGDKLCLPFGSVYMLMAKAKVIPLTPIRLNWKQQLAGAKLTIPGPSIRNM